ncbi:MAG: bacillithiol system redox-active protein YtxJ [Leadbetterella sp.]|nr:bacillithiol system redox-active protein YtxJ [Leadbetterella sp.]
MIWQKLTDIAQLDTLTEESRNVAVGIFKHSTRCSISATALDRLERNWPKAAGTEAVKMYYLDLIAHRDISNAVAERYGVQHESPQFILLKDGEAVYHESHYDIHLGEILERAQG